MNFYKGTPPGSILQEMENTVVQSCDQREQQNTPLFLKEKGGAGERGNFFSREKKFPLSPAHSFTLIELLVVIAIIAILAAILLPALQNARNRGVATSCISMRKQVGHWVQDYTDTFDDWLMPWRWGEAGASERWYSALYIAKITKWNRLDQFYGCPAAPCDTGNTAGAPRTMGASITINARLTGFPDSYYYFKTNRIKKPSIKYLITDATNGYYFNENNYLSSSINPSQPAARGFYPWHLGKKAGTMLYADLHVDLLQMMNNDIPHDNKYFIGNYQ